jgi:hypothetical protein
MSELTDVVELLLVRVREPVQVDELDIVLWEADCVVDCMSDDVDDAIAFELVP